MQKIQLVHGGSIISPTATHAEMYMVQCDRPPFSHNFLGKQDMVDLVFYEHFCSNLF
jgi:hypothetical protein